MFFFWKTCFANRGFLGLFVKENVSILEPHLGSWKNGILMDFPNQGPGSTLQPSLVVLTQICPRNAFFCHHTAFPSPLPSSSTLYASFQFNTTYLFS